MSRVPLKCGAFCADAHGMRVWFKNLSALLGEEEAEESSVRQIVEAAAARGAVVGLSRDARAVRPDPDCGVLDAIDGEDLVISRHEPDSEWLKDINPGDKVYIAIAATRGFYSGETEVISRWSGHDIGLDRCGYRVRVPKALLHSQRRTSERMPVAFDLAPRAKVRTPDLVSEVGSGMVLDLSGTGMRMRIALPREIVVGELLAVEASFSNSIPSFEGLVEVVHVFPSRVPDARILGLRFVDERPDIAQAIHDLDLKRRGREAA
ncbi:MAG: hypothetical protein RLY21_1638 [Planctomycetota bacterium]